LPGNIVWFARLILWFTRGSTRSSQKHTDVRDNASAFIASLAGTAAMSVQRGFDAANQDGACEGFGQEANGSDLQRPGTDTLIGERRNKNKRHVVTPSTHLLQQVQTAHAGHLHIRNDTRGVARLDRLQEVLGRRKCTYHVSMRAEEIVSSCADGCIVVNDGNHRKR